MNPYSLFFEKNKEEFKGFMWNRWIFLRELEYFLLDKLTYSEVKQERDVYYFYLDAVISMRNRFMDILCDFYSDLEVQQNFYQLSKQILSLSRVIENSFSTNTVVPQ